MDPRYPIGKFETKPFSADQKKDWLQDIQFLPALIEQCIENLDEHQLNTPYRDGGWTLRQVVHHVADSHINAYCRFKLALTEENPTIRTYEEGEWAKLDDIERIPVNISVTLLYTLHSRLHATLLHLPDESWKRTFFHPGQNRQMTLWDLLGMYAWHGKHHVAHIMNLREARGW